LCAALLCAPSAAFAQASFTGPSGGGLTFAPPPPNSTRPVPPADIPEPPPPAVEPAPQPHTAQPSAPLPAPKQAAPREPHTNMPTVPTGKYPLGVAARYSQNGPLIQRVLTWRVFTEKGENGLPALVAEAKDAFPVFPLA